MAQQLRKRTWPLQTITGFSTTFPTRVRVRHLIALCYGLMCNTCRFSLSHYFRHIFIRAGLRLIMAHGRSMQNGSRTASTVVTWWKGINNSQLMMLMMSAWRRRNVLYYNVLLWKINMTNWDGFNVWFYSFMLCVPFRIHIVLTLTLTADLGEGGSGSSSSSSSSSRVSNSSSSSGYSP